jgi:hypothetical protein
MTYGQDDAIWTLAIDVLSARAIVWAASVGREAELTREAHLFFFDRYRRLAAAHRWRGHTDRAARLQGKADEHFRLAGGDGPPYAAAMAMPRPKSLVATDAVSHIPVGGPHNDDAA